MAVSVTTLLLLACRPQPGDGTPQDSVRETDDSTPADDSTTDDSGTDDSGTEDRDGDGWIEPDDCDDDDETVYPSAPEACVDHKDNDCNGVVDGCDVDRLANVNQRLVDPDAEGWETNGQVGFGTSLGFLDKGGVSLWIRPQPQSKNPIWRAASASGWTEAQISGVQTYHVDSPVTSMVETDGDLDGDGSRDLVVAEFSPEGAAIHLFYDPIVGETTLDSAHASVVATASVGGSPASRIYAVGDLTSDGTDDLLLGGENQSWLIAGPILDAVDVSKDIASVPTTVSELWSATGLDFDGDGMRDLAVANPYDSAAGPDFGAAYVYLGPHSSNLEPATADYDWYGTDGVTGERAGLSIDSGDFDGDGRDDLVVRSLAAHLASQPGAVYVIDQEAPTGQEMRVVARAQIAGNRFDDAGDASGTVADFDHDNRSDIVVCSLGTNPNAETHGYVSVLLGPFDGLLTADADANLTLRGSEEDSSVGLAVATGDLDGDGEIEMATHSSAADANGYTRGVVDIVTPALIFAP